MLYPPYIEGKLPAQQGDTLRIPFSFNRAGGFGFYPGASKQFELKIRTVATDSNPLGDEDVLLTNYVAQTDMVEFNIGYRLHVGQFYKVQMALVEGSDKSVYSTVGIFKYTATGIIKILDLNETKINKVQTSYQGAYMFKTLLGYDDGEPIYDYESVDTTERVSQYKFDIYSKNELIETSGWLQHSTSSDTFDSYTQCDIYTPKMNMETRDIYQIQYHIKTLNNCMLSSPMYMLKHAAVFLPQVSLNTSCTNHFNQGYISLDLHFKEAQHVTGKFIIWRDDVDNNVPMEAIQTILFDKDFQAGETFTSFKDYNIELGKTYKYYLQQTSTDSPPLFTNKVELGQAVAAFDDAFLWDKDMRIRLKYNPKVSSIKDTILESKVDTIGGRYPFFFRNGNVSYKEFPISALLSLTMDKESDEWTDENGNPFTDLTTNNIYLEREYKMKVLKWLNNGQPKVFTSPTEGKYLVRLMSVSLSPMEQLGRMLHTFSATAYEVGGNTYSDLQKHQMVQLESEFVTNLKVTNKILTLTQSHPEEEINLISPAVYARVREAMPGTQLTCVYQNGYTTTVQIGSTGYYDVFIDKANPLVKVHFYYSKDNDAWVPATSIFDGQINSTIYFEYIYQRQPIYYIYEKESQKRVTGIEYLETVSQVFGGSKQNIIPRYLSNMLYLRIQKRDVIDNDEYSSGNPDAYKFTMDGTVVDLSTIGRIEYNCHDFGDIFTPDSLILGPGLYADMYYGMTIISTSEEENIW